MERIAIIGMGPIGVSIGLGLRRSGLEHTEVVGMDRNRDALSQAKELGSLDRATGNLRGALKGAQLVVLDTLLPDTRDMLEAIGPDLDKGCVVTDTGAAKVQVMEWARTYLPAGTSFVGGRPILRQPVSRLDDADATLFNDSYYCVIPAESADPEAVKSVVGMVESLGANPLFLDAHEHDFYAAALVGLPVLLSAALVSSTTASPSWREMSRLAGSEFREASNLAASDPLDSAVFCHASVDALDHWLGRVIAELTVYKEQLRETDEMLLKSLIRAWEERARWEAGKVVEKTSFDVPSAAQSAGEALFGSRLVKRYRQITGAIRRPPWKYPTNG